MIHVATWLLSNILRTALTSAPEREAVVGSIRDPADVTVPCRQHVPSMMR